MSNGRTRPRYVVRREADPPALPHFVASDNYGHKDMNTRPRYNDGTVSSIALAVLLAIPAIAAPARAEPIAYDLLIERSPVAAGTVTPNTGLHRFCANSLVSLKAEPQPGYRFAYWLGQVADPTAQQTTVRVDGHKLVVAVFQPEAREPVEQQVASGGGGDGLMLASPTDLSVPSWSPAGGARPRTITPPAVRPEIVTPEPATIALLGLGFLWFRRHAYSVACRRTPRTVL
jgi:hypothetical protein